MIILIMPASVLADFYVIPVGKTSLHASDVKQLHAEALKLDSSNFGEITLDGNISPLYTAPDNKVFVITVIDLVPKTTGPGPFRCILNHFDTQSGTTQVRHVFWMSGDKVESFHFSPGLIVPSGSSLRLVNVSNSIDVSAEIVGYETNP